MQTRKEKIVDTLPYKKVSWFYRFVKRSFDIFVSFMVILVFSWLYLILWLLVKLTSKGPAIFKDNRVGKNYKEVHVYKFRTMYIDAETNIEKYLSPEQLERWKVERKVDNDPRITPVGKFLRRTSLDEIPQFFNILFGSMSFIGPRPITNRELNDHFSVEEQKILLSARPGLIGYWGVIGRSDVEFDHGRQKLELDYFKLRSLWFDFTLILRVIPSVILGRGAH